MSSFISLILSKIIIYSPYFNILQMTSLIITSSSSPSYPLFTLFPMIFLSLILTYILSTNILSPYSSSNTILILIRQTFTVLLKIIPNLTYPLQNNPLHQYNFFTVNSYPTLIPTTNETFSPNPLTIFPINLYKPSLPLSSISSLPSLKNPHFPQKLLPNIPPTLHIFRNTQYNYLTFFLLITSPSLPHLPSTLQPPS